MSTRSTSMSLSSVLALIISGLWPTSSFGLTLTAIDQERGLFAEAASGESGAFDSDVDPAETTDLLPYTAIVTSNANTANGFATATATIDSNFAADSVLGSGSASASANTLAVDVLARAPSDSHFEVVFSPDVTASVAFAGRIDTAATGARADSHTRIVLSNAVTGAVLSSYSAGLGTDLTFGEFVTLLPAESYRLSATSLAHAQAADVVETSSAEASYVVYVPEPGAGLQLVAGWFGVLGLGRLRTRRTRRFSEDDGVQQC